MKKLAISVATVALLFVGCSEQETQQKSMQQQMPALPVQAHTVEIKDTKFTKRYSAIIKPFQEVDVIARVSGLLQEENFNEGDFVTKGSVLFSIEKDEYEAALDEAKAALLRAEASFTRASKEWKRAEYLYENKAISEQQRDDILFSYQDARAELARTKATLKSAQIQYDYTTITAPISGIIGISSSDVGNYISTQNAQLATITATDPVYAEFSIASDDVRDYRSQIKLGSAITSKDKKFTGTIDYIAPKLDAQTDTLFIRALFNNADAQMIIGSYIEIDLGGLEFKNVATVPQNAILKTVDATLVYVIKEGKAVMQPVEVGYEHEGSVIIHSGLNNGDQIVISNIAKLRPNSDVKVIGTK
jgi:membrane fusion protein, multidrug efflux system